MDPSDIVLVRNNGVLIIYVIYMIVNACYLVIAIRSLVYVLLARTESMWVAYQIMHLVTHSIALLVCCLLVSRQRSHAYNIMGSIILLTLFICWIVFHEWLFPPYMLSLNALTILIAIPLLINVKSTFLAELRPFKPQASAGVIISGPGDGGQRPPIMHSYQPSHSPIYYTSPQPPVTISATIPPAPPSSTQ